MSDITRVFKEDQLFVDFIYEKMLSVQDKLVNLKNVVDHDHKTNVILRLTYTQLIQYTGRSRARNAFIEQLIRRFTDKGLSVVLIVNAEEKLLEIELSEITIENEFTSLEEMEVVCS